MSYQQGYTSVDQPQYQQPVAQGQGGWWYANHKPQSRAHIREWAGTNEWATSMLSAPCAEPGTCLLACIAPWCCVYSQRKKLLMDDMRNYECCAGIWGPACTERCNGCTEDKGDLCLCLEVTFCLTCATHGNRWMVMQQYNLQNDCCDIFIMWLGCFCRVLACLLRSEHLEHCASMVYYMTIGCMVAQQEHQMVTQGYPMGVNAAAPLMT